ncbi:MAG: CotH kinase family protein, partial [Oscillospiraceae bacterium]|nr:CotH kinase family protein [Oscillospiraceae bacterium]
MMKSKHITAVCCIAIAFAVVFTCLFAAGVFPFTVPETSEAEIGYEELFDTSYVHSINIDVDESSWQDMLDNATAEEYISCNVTIDGTKLTNVAIRPKGNTSLSNVESLDSERYSFKIKFDEYEDGTTYKGLDKLCLNNIIQDNTYMKDYYSYRMMSEAGAYAPLCSYIYITVNNEDWGLYLAVEAIEEAFARRNFGENYGQIYKPESMAMGGGMGKKDDSDGEDMGGGQGGVPGGGAGRGGRRGRQGDHGGQGGGMAAI